MKRILSVILALCLALPFQALAAQGYTLLHDVNNASSVAFLAQYGSAGAVVTNPTSWIGVTPAFQGVPCIVYEDSQGQRHSLFNPASMAAVTAWRAAIDNPPKSNTLSAYVFSNRFTDAEAVAIETAAANDPVIRVAERKLGLVQGQVVDLTDPGVQNYVGYLVAKGLLTSDRATAILTP